MRYRKDGLLSRRSGGCLGAISWASGFEPSANGVLISLRVEDMEAALVNLSRWEGKILQPKTKIEAEGMGYFSTFRDSEGNRIGLYSDH